MNELKEKGIVLFDGVCNFCNSSVNFVMRKDNSDYFRFLPLQSDKGKSIVSKFNLDPENLQTVILLERGRVYTKSTAAIRIARKLRGGWKLFYGFVIVPAFIRDVMYNFVARNRYKWWGKRDVCMVPTPDVKNKFLC